MSRIVEYRKGVRRRSIGRSMGDVTGLGEEKARNRERWRGEVSVDRKEGGGTERGHEKGSNKRRRGMGGG